MKMQGGSEGTAEHPADSAGASSSTGTQTFGAPSTTETTVSSEAPANDPNDFRTRFHRSLVAPSPFGAGPVSAASTSSAIAGDSATQQQQQGAAQPLPTSIDPRLSRLLPTPSAEFAEMVAKMAAAANAGILNGSSEGQKQMNGAGQAEIMGEEDGASEGDEVEGVVGGGEDQANGQTA